MNRIADLLKEVLTNETVRLAVGETLAALGFGFFMMALYGAWAVTP
jgi:hypothetical protein